MIVSQRGSRSRPRSAPPLRAVGLLATAAVLATCVAAAPAGALGGTVAAAATAVPDLPGSVDSFDAATLGSQWSITNEASSAWSLATNPGSLTLTAQAGDTYQTTNTAKNVFAVDVPDGDFDVVTTVHAPVSKVYQGAGLIAFDDLDNYVRSGLTYVGSLSASGVAIENDIETNASFTAASFGDRPGSQAETLRLRRTGDVVTTSYWDASAASGAGAWVQTGSVTVSFDITHLGLYALAAQDGTTFPAVFDDFAYDAADGKDVVPPGTFTFLGGDGDQYLSTEDGRLGLTDVRPTSTLAFTATEVSEGAVTLASGGVPVVLGTGETLAMGDPGATPASLRITDAGGGKVVLRTADATGDDGYVGLQDGLLVVGSKADAVKLTVQTVKVTDGSSLDIDGDATSVKASDDLYGIFYEDINYAADGGLYAELVRNRSFEFNSSDASGFTGMTAWSTLARGDGAGSTATVGTGDQRLNDNNRYYLTLDAKGAGAGVQNAGYNSGIAIEKGATYDFSVWARSATAQDLAVRLETKDGATAYATGKVAVDGSDTWKKYTVSLTADTTTDSARLAVLAGAASTVRLDMVSLFPDDTWVGPVNGKSVLRKDLAQKIADLKPKFLRFPGGCVTDVGTFPSYTESGGTDRKRMYQWKETIGAVEDRPTNANFWGYNQSYGIGYMEYFEFAEDLGATPLPVVTVGAQGCGSSLAGTTDSATIQRYVQDTLDLLEFADGDVTTEWGAKRAALGHPKPFGVKYIELGNEENNTEFEKNFPTFRAAVNAAYPDVTVISNSGPDDSGSRFDTLWDYNRQQKVDMVDEHYYNSPSWFLSNTNRYDTYDRNGPKVFLGEYASQGNTLWNSLSEAAYMTSLERNSDVVQLASYAPLLSNEDYVQWSPDAIWFDNDESWGSPNYYVQKMFMNNLDAGDEVVPSTYSGPQITPEPLDGGVFLSTWSTAATYDNVKVTSNDDSSTLFSDDFSAGASQWAAQSGTWSVANGAYTQSSTSVTDARTIVTDAYTKDWSSYTLELDATKTAGSEGFLVGFAATGANNFFWWNIGGWTNTRQALQKADGGSAGEVKAVENSSVTTGKTYHLKVVVDGRDIKLYMDGVLQMDYEDVVATQDVFQDVTRDASTGDLVVKVVNTSDTTRRTAVHVSDVGVRATGTATVLTGLPTDTNTKAKKEKVVPVEHQLTGLSGDFSYDFQPYSVTFLRLHTVDATAPTIDSLDLSSSGVRGWYADPVTVTATASDDRGVTSLETRVDGGAWVGSDSTSKASVQVSGEGEHTVEVRATDADGNVSEIRPVTFAIDTTPPISNAVVDAKARTVMLRAADSGAGTGSIQYRVGTSGAWLTYTAPVKVGSTATTVQYRAVDALGNVEATNAVVVPAAGVVLKSTSTVAVASPSSTTYGTSPKVTVRVTGAGGTPTGTVRVTDGKTLVGSATLSGGKATVTVSSSLAVGSHSLAVTYSGDKAFGSSSDTVKVKVTKTSSKTSVSVSPKAPTHAQKATVTAKVTTVKPSGTVTVTVTHTVSGKTKTVVSQKVALTSKGTASLRLPQVAKGTYTVKVAYAGSSTATGSSAATTLRITK
ncbi:alpha-L-arabinofuranosidase C-terminal domain-containing protein [Luteimicrobium subarcticum]|uniref:non-reducing end alpha-L-arabinofuranosidase n=1 Tax=Luteimicrobium subarcticum TaxID=620910 RepID=A0A2M8WVU3_9MICO|nr:alpha-L-arabinofuranosidase C-terminal domain-containing protein [Luteimicrobium subarcticum]PJI95037.1 alpha-L-arabinofuranosidase [Luteimicrobium subarcticum]